MKSKLKKSELRQLIKEELNNFNENKEAPKTELEDVKKIIRLLPKIDNKAEYLDLFNKVLNSGDEINGVLQPKKKLIEKWKLSSNKS